MCGQTGSLFRETKLAWQIENVIAFWTKQRGVLAEQLSRIDRHIVECQNHVNLLLTTPATGVCPPSPYLLPRSHGSPPPPPPPEPRYDPHEYDPDDPDLGGTYNDWGSPISPPLGQGPSTKRRSPDDPPGL